MQMENHYLKGKEETQVCMCVYTVLLVYTHIVYMKMYVHRCVHVWNVFRVCVCVVRTYYM